MQVKLIRTADTRSFNSKLIQSANLIAENRVGRLGVVLFSFYKIKLTYINRVKQYFMKKNGVVAVKRTREDSKSLKNQEV